ncbi:MAG: hypothetical protein M3Q07_06425 [Pseudobdellovibrionaceae bacterium]|nr:hypothetical protein [Pseudobdellovibrionaceae bacterium]
MPTQKTRVWANLDIEKAIQGMGAMRTAPRQESVAPTGDRFVDTLQNHFGFSTFRPGQSQIIEQIIEQIMAGKASAAVFPTGSGKSLCYKLSALVISPLIALMKDHIDALLAKGIQAPQGRIPARPNEVKADAEHRAVIKAA